MNGWQIAAILFVFCLIVVILTRSITLANRLDRLHRRMVATRDELDQLSVQRAQLCIQLTQSMSGPAGQKLKQDAQACHEASAVLLAHDHLDRRELPRIFDQQAVVERWEHESALTRDLRHCTIDDVEEASQEVLTELIRVCYRIHVARTMHNVDVVQAQHLRSDPLVALFHLYGSAPMPASIDFDDDLTQAPVFSAGSLAALQEESTHE